MLCQVAYLSKIYPSHTKFCESSFTVPNYCFADTKWSFVPWLFFQHPFCQKLVSSFEADSKITLVRIFQSRFEDAMGQWFPTESFDVSFMTSILLPSTNQVNIFLRARHSFRDWLTLLVNAGETFQQNSIWTEQILFWSCPNMMCSMVFFDWYIFLWGYMFGLFFI